MPFDDAIKFIYKDFCNKTKKVASNVNQHPDAIQTLFKTLADNRSLTVLQYEHIIKYLKVRQDVQRKAEIGEDAADINYMDTLSTMKLMTPALVQPQAPAPVNTSHEDLQKKILEILNKKPLMQQLAKNAEVKSKPMTNTEKEELKNRLLQDDKIKLAMASLRNFKKK